MVEFEGVLAVNKPSGWTSHDVVQKLRRMLRLKRIGHAGTLDPDVTGVLPVALGKATRLIEYMQEMPKEYRAEMMIGFATDTEDISGTVVARSERPVIERAELEQVMASFIGEIEQIPPMYSAVKVDGRRLYELAREGREVERKARTVSIYEIEIEEAELDAEYPRIRFRVRCSKGTYIRTLCKDIGRALGYPAVMSGLVRTMSCGQHLADARTLEEIADLLAAGQLADHIQPADELLVDLPAVYVEQEVAERLLQGQRVPLDRQVKGKLSGQRQEIVRVYAPGDRFIGICRLDGRLLRPHKMIHA